MIQTACQNAIQLPSPETKSQKEKSLKMVVEGLQEIVTAILMSAKYIGDFTLQFALPTVEARPRGASFLEPASKAERFTQHPFYLLIV